MFSLATSLRRQQAFFGGPFRLQRKILLGLLEERRLLLLDLVEKIHFLAFKEVERDADDQESRQCRYREMAHQAETADRRC